MYYYGIVSAGILAVLILLGFGRESLRSLWLTQLSALAVILTVVLLSIIKPINAGSVEIGISGLLFISASAVLLFAERRPLRVLITVLDILLMAGVLMLLRIYARGFLELRHGELLIPFVAGIAAFIFAKRARVGFILCVLPVFLSDLTLYLVPVFREDVLLIGSGLQFDHMLTAFVLFFVVFTAVGALSKIRSAQIIA